MTDDPETIVRVSRNETLARECELVLLAQGLAPQMHSTGDGIVITVPRRELDRARAALAAYEKENSPKAQPPELPPAPIDLRAGVAAALVLLAAFVATVWNAALPWLERGSANAARILDGELWRAVTALTLHADVAHALSNASAMAVFFAAVSGQLGAGIGAALVLLAGAAGNLANAYLRGPPHDAVGASTAVFAAVGLLGSFAMVRRHAIGNRRRAWVTIAASLALLGMLGSSGARVDVLAHLLGFLAGAVLGIAAALVFSRPAAAAVQWICGAATILTIVGSWLLALD